MTMDCAAETPDISCWMAIRLCAQDFLFLGILRGWDMARWIACRKTPIPLVGMVGMSVHALIYGTTRPYEGALLSLISKRGFKLLNPDPMAHLCDGQT